MKKYLGNAFSLGMLDSISEGASATLRIEALGIDHAKAWVAENGPQSCVGHADTAILLTGMLSVPVEMRRESTSLQGGDQLLVAQYNGPRLPEGATALPPGAKIRWFLVTV